MKKIIFILLISTTFVDANKLKVVTLKNGAVVFYEESAGLWISRDCRNKTNCDAREKIKLLKNINKKIITGGRNPGAVVCKENLQGVVWHGHDTEENEETICCFKDKSCIKNSSLLSIYHKQPTK